MRESSSEAVGMCNNNFALKKFTDRPAGYEMQQKATTVNLPVNEFCLTDNTIPDSDPSETTMSQVVVHCIPWRTTPGAIPR